VPANSKKTICFPVPCLVQEYKASSNGASGASTRDLGGRYDNMKYSSILNDEPMPDAASEKEQVE
jgi:hypothetical protein